MARKAYVIRLRPGGVRDNLQLCLDENIVGPGWSDAQGLIAEKDYLRFREIIHQTFNKNDTSYIRSGKSAGMVWQFIHEMSKGDLVVVPRPGIFYVAEILSDVSYRAEYVVQDIAYQRSAKWLNGKKGISRDWAKNRLRLRMKAYQTIANATDCIQEIEGALKEAESGNKATFSDDLRNSLRDIIVCEIQEGKMDDYSFESLVQALFMKMGARNVIRTPRIFDKGDDIFFDFGIGDLFPTRVVVQVKHHKDITTTKDVVYQLLSGMEKHQAKFGIAISSAKFSEDIETMQRELEDQTSFSDKDIRLIDGENFAEMLLDYGIIGRPMSN